MTGISDSATAPVSQNQLTARPAIQVRPSCISSRTMRLVEATILRSTFRPGAPIPVAGMNRLATQHVSATAINCTTTLDEPRSWLAA